MSKHVGREIGACIVSDQALLMVSFRDGGKIAFRERGRAGDDTLCVELFYMHTGGPCMRRSMAKWHGVALKQIPREIRRGMFKAFGKKICDAVESQCNCVVLDCTPYIHTIDAYIAELGLQDHLQLTPLVSTTTTKKTTKREVHAVSGHPVKEECPEGEEEEEEKGPPCE